MAYQAKWITVENGVTALLIRDVVMASYLMRGERPDQSRGWMTDLDDAWWQEAARTAANREHKGKFAGLIFKRNVFTHQDPFVAGRFERLRWERPYAKADFVVTDPTEGVELIQGSEGHFSEDIPELRVAGVSVRDREFKELQDAAVTAARLRAPDADLVALAAAPQETQMFTPEQIAQIKQIVQELLQGGGQPQMAQMQKAVDDAVNKAVQAAVAKLPKQPEPAKADPAKPGTDPEAARLKTELEKVTLAASQTEARLAELERDREIDGYVT
jgi:hypothetical protein